MTGETEQSHVRVFAEMDSPALDRAINEEIEGGGYKVTGVSITSHGEYLVALVSFESP